MSVYFCGVALSLGASFVSEYLQNCKIVTSSSQEVLECLSSSLCRQVQRHFYQVSCFRIKSN